MTEQMFEEAMASALIKVFVDTYGEAAWLSQSETEQSETLHKLLHGFLAAAARRA